MDFLEQYYNLIAVAGIVLGALNCYLGYKIFKILLAIIGFIAGSVIGGFAVSYATGNTSMGVAVGLGIGIVIAILSVALSHIGVFIFVGFLSFATCYLLSSGDMTVSLVIGAVMGIIGAILTRHLIIISTAFSGGVSISRGICELTDIDNTSIYILLAAFFIITGLIVQYKTNTVKKVDSDTPDQKPDTSEQLPDTTEAPLVFAKAKKKK